MGRSTRWQFQDLATALENPASELVTIMWSVRGEDLLHRWRIIISIISGSPPKPLTENPSDILLRALCNDSRTPESQLFLFLACSSCLGRNLCNKKVIMANVLCYGAPLSVKGKSFEYQDSPQIVKEKYTGNEKKAAKMGVLQFCRRLPSGL